MERWLRWRQVGRLAAIGLAVSMTLASTARAEMYAAVSAYPIWSSSSRDLGYSVGVAVMGREEESAWSFGGELEYRSVPLEFGDALDLHGEITEVRTLFLRLHVRHDFMREALVRPYINAGTGLAFNWMDVRNQSAEQGYRTVTDTAQVGFDGLLGVGLQTEVPILTGLRAGLEMRASMNVLPIETVHDNGTLDTAWVFFGGFGVYLGVGYVF